MSDSSISAATGASYRPLLLLLGPPGAGKGTQCSRLAGVLGIPNISTGEILREQVRRETALGRQVRDIMDAGGLVSDDVMLQILADRLAASDCSHGFILDGFPRTREQAGALDALLASLAVGWNVLIVRLAVPETCLLERVAGRQVCPACGAAYGAAATAPRIAGRCDADGALLAARRDDRKETVLQRFSVYEAEIASILEYYARRAPVLEVDGTRPIPEVTSSILSAVKALERLRIVPRT